MQFQDSVPLYRNEICLTNKLTRPRKPDNGVLIVREPLKFYQSNGAF